MIKVLNKYYFLFLSATIILLSQAWLFNQIYIFNIPVPYLYVIFLINLPYKINVPAALIIAFIYGLLLDVFQDTFGLHAGGCVLIMWLRVFFLRYYAASKDYDFKTHPDEKNMGIVTYFLYIFIMVFCYNFFILFIEAFSINNLLHLFKRLLLHSFFTFLFIIIYNRIFN